jgi:hypothetical protein
MLSEHPMDQVAAVAEQELEQRLECEHAARRAEQREAAAFRRRSGPAHKHRVGSGHGDGSLAALRDSAAATYACCCCGALVDAGRARAAARRCGRRAFWPGDGCAGPACAQRFRPRKHAHTQRAMAAALLRGARRLVDWPAALGMGVGRRRCDAAAARAAAHALALLAALPLCPCAHCRYNDKALSIPAG